jgi:hypothetical protein
MYRADLVLGRLAKLVVEGKQSVMADNLALSVHQTE